MAIITISRGTFSGGIAVAEELSRKLGYPCISKEIILDAAEEFGIPESKLVAAMEEPPNSWLESPTKKMAHLNYVRYALLKRASENNLVYHGYAGHLLLGDIAHVMCIRVIADMEYRIKAAMEKEGFSRREAISVIKKLDKHSRNWTKFLYGVDWKDPAIYDLVINLNRINIKSAVDIIAQIAEQDDFKPDENSKTALDNQVLSSMVWAALTKDNRTNNLSLHVASDNGVVNLRGSAGSEQELRAINEITKNVPGVKEVVNEVGIGADWQW